MTSTSHNQTPALDRADRTWLDTHIDGPVLIPVDHDYASETATFNLTLAHRPLVVVGATSTADVQNAVRFAGRRGLPVSINATGHGAVVSATGSLMINTSRMSDIKINSVAPYARIQAGVRANQLIPAAGEHGLAAISGSSPLVGSVGFTLGGGLSPVFGRSKGFAADHVRAFKIVTADGQLRHVTADREPELFWAVRGGKGNFGVVTELESGLFPASRLYGGGLYFGGEHAPAVLETWRGWVEHLPESLSTSFCLLRLPDLPFVPEPMRGRLTLHLRIAYLGSADEGAALVEPLRAAAPAFLDTVAEMPYANVASIHNDPTEPGVAVDRTALLRELSPQALDTLLSLAGPDTPPENHLMMTEVRLLGGALSRPPALPNAVGNRGDAEFCLFIASIPAPVEGDIERIRAVEERFLDRMAPWGTGGMYANFMSTEDTSAASVRMAYDAVAYERLVGIKKTYDPSNMFRINHNIRAA
ncbi:FAD-binding oxidoreductase [Actinoplanes sp. TBRC 11911]|uniref:FAD-binding oxidoreductase n=1 Tax=Actinoplanes sp. TBRC 11911 TaxID=2729386 RepID=UPI001B7D607D|nr:FAD-binding oxidoreductase [Actinoplanes sp. TBRC 11911]